MARPSLQTRIWRAIVVRFAVLTVAVAIVALWLMKDALQADLHNRATVIARAVEQSAEVSVGARTGNADQVVRALSWLTSMGDDLVAVVAFGNDGQPLAGVNSAGVLASDALEELAKRVERFPQAIVEVSLVPPKRERVVGDVSDQIDREQDGDPAKNGANAERVRVVLSGRGQILRQTTAVLATGLLLGIVALLTLLVISKDTFAGLAPAFAQAKRMAQGDFTARLKPDFAELEVLFAALNEISGSLSGMIGNARSVGDDVNSAAETVRGAAHQMRSGADLGTLAVGSSEAAVAAVAHSAKENAAQLGDVAKTADASVKDTETIERTNATTVEAAGALRGEVDRQTTSVAVIGNRARLLSDNAQSLAIAAEAARGSAQRTRDTSAQSSAGASDAARLADSALYNAQAGGKAIEGAVQRIREIAQVSSAIEGNLNQLTQRVEAMKPVLGAIAEVTSRTSLLALNAGIVAAQAGASGQAFQVVVDELKSLAGRTSQLTAMVEDSVRTVLLQRGRTDDVAAGLRRLLSTSIDDAQHAAEALDAIRRSTAQSQEVSASIVQHLATQDTEMQDTLSRIDVVEQAGKSVEQSARALADEARVLKDVADRVTTVTRDVVSASKQQGELAQRVGRVLTTLTHQVRSLVGAQANQHGDIVKVETGMRDLRRFADDTRQRAAQLEETVEPVRDKAKALSNALHRFQTRELELPIRKP